MAHNKLFEGKDIFSSGSDRHQHILTSLDDFGQFWTILDDFGPVWRSLKEFQTLEEEKY